MYTLTYACCCLVGKFLQSLKIFQLAVSLGSVESLASSPAIMTHGDVPKEARDAIGTYTQCGWFISHEDNFCCWLLFGNIY